MKTVSIVVPCYNEEKTIFALLEAIFRQTYPKEFMEVIIADGMSTDSTLKQIAKFAELHKSLSVRVIENPKRIIPAGLNLGLENAKGEIIIRMDAHSKPKADYVELCVKDLENSKGNNVGGIWEIQAGGEGWIAQSIAMAASHPIGVGGARYRVGGKAQYVDTVPFGAFYKNLIEEIGGFNETLLTNEDYEFNTRIRKSGGKIWFDPNIVSTYFARTTLRDLAAQYWRYGFWKVKMLQRYPESLKWRQGLPPIFVFTLLMLTILSLFIPIFRFVLLVEVMLYLVVLFLAGVQVALRERKLHYVIGVPLAIATMHFSWGVAFLWRWIDSALKKKRNKKEMDI